MNARFSAEVVLISKGSRQLSNFKRVAGMREEWK
jgi:hypothetical protein